MIRQACTARMPSGSRGVTLIELIVVVAIVAVLSTIAWPGYASVLQRANRNDARLALLQLQILQESHFATHRRYAAQLGDTATADTLAASRLSSAGHYRLSLSAPEDGQTYTARATATGRQAGDRQCAQLAIDVIGRRRSADSDGRWSEDGAARCWK